MICASEVAGDCESQKKKTTSASNRLKSLCNLAFLVTPILCEQASFPKSSYAMKIRVPRQNVENHYNANVLRVLLAFKDEDGRFYARDDYSKSMPVLMRIHTVLLTGRHPRQNDESKALNQLEALDAAAQNSATYCCNSDCDSVEREGERQRVCLCTCESRACLVKNWKPSRWREHYY